MTQGKIAQQKDELTVLKAGAGYPESSLKRCWNLIGRQEMLLEELEHIKSFTNRFARI